MTENDRKDQLGMAALRMVGSVAGYMVNEIPQDYGIDFGIHKVGYRGARRLDLGAVFYVQLKTSERPDVVGSEVVYDLEVKTFNDMVTMNKEGDKPLVLVLMALKGDSSSSLDVRHNEISVGNSLYWYRTDATDLSTNTGTVRIKIPVTQKLDITTFDQLVRSLDV